MLVVNGFTQVEKIDYNEIFSHMIKLYSIRMLMGMVNQYNLELEYMNVITT